mmetsp:Transcript_11396/g.37424  ORF Transcript_11396/g.37424 Transcript_11396/m.37424 type:complete len:317 (-) Transcript_11396:226-1176(-)
MVSARKAGPFRGSTRTPTTRRSRRRCRRRLNRLGVLLVLHLGGGAQPDGFVVVQELPLGHLLRDGFRGRDVLLLVLVVVTHLNVVLVLVRLLLLVVVILSLLNLVVVHLNLLLHRLGRPEVDGEVDKLGVLGDELLELELLGVLGRLLLEVDANLSPALNLLALGVLRDGKVAVGARLPDPLLVVFVALGHHLDVVRHEVHGVKADAKLPDEVHVARPLHLLQEGGRARLGDGAEVVDEVLPRHANALVRDGQNAVLGVELDANVELRRVPFAERVRVRERQEANLVERVRRVRDELAKKDVLVAVQAVDDDVHQA